MEVKKNPEAHLLQREREYPQSRDLLQEFLILSHLPLKTSSFFTPDVAFLLILFWGLLV